MGQHPGKRLSPGATMRLDSESVSQTRVALAGISIRHGDPNRRPPAGRPPTSPHPRARANRHFPPRRRETADHPGSAIRTPGSPIANTLTNHPGKVCKRAEGEGVPRQLFAVCPKTSTIMASTAGRLGPTPALPVAPLRGGTIGAALYAGCSPNRAILRKFSTTSVSAPHTLVDESLLAARFLRREGNLSRVLRRSLLEDCVAHATFDLGFSSTTGSPLGEGAHMNAVTPTLLVVDDEPFVLDTVSE